MKERKRTRSIFLALGLAVLLGALIAIQAGSLEPPGPPAPTMKTLDEVEPRTPILASDIPLTITQSGSYYLAENVTVTSGDGITIVAEAVTLDLEGFTVEITNEAAYGIRIASSARVVTIRNGRLVGGYVAVWRAHSADASGRVKIENLEVTGTSWEAIGFRDVESAEVRDCRIHDNKSGIGVGNYTSDDPFTARIEDNIVTDTVESAVYLQGVRGGRVSGNVIRGFGWGGIHLQAGLYFIGETGGTRIEGNAVTGGSGTNGRGIWVYGTTHGNQIVGNVVSGNGADGIHIGTLIGNKAQWNVIENNLVEANDGHGIYFSGDNNCYRDNMVRGNSSTAIQDNGAGNVDAGGNVL